MHKTIQLELLKLDLGNYRTGSGSTGQRDAIRKMLDDQKEKLFRLASDIQENGLNPTEAFLVTPDPDEKGHFIVKDGNRRLTALLLMKGPEHAASSPHKRQFEELAVAFKDHSILRDGVTCYISSDPKEINTWMWRRHGGEQNGIGLVTWNSAQKGLYEVDQSIRTRLFALVLRYLQGKGQLTQEMEDYLLNNASTVDRLFETKGFRETLGIIIDSGAVSFQNGDEEAGAKLLGEIVREMSNITVAHLMTVEQRNAFAEQFLLLSVAGPAPQTIPSTGPGTSKAGATSKPSPSPSPSPSTPQLPPKENSATSSSVSQLPPNQPDSTSSGGNALPSSTNRDTLALKGRANTLTIQHPRINRIYLEARKLKVANFPETASFLMRAFLEMSTEYYLEERQLPLPKGKNAWSDRGITLDDKIKLAFKDLDPNGNGRQLEQPRKGVSNLLETHSLDTLHGYLHNKGSNPTDDKLKHTWEQWHPYFKMMFDRLRSGTP